LKFARKLFFAALILTVLSVSRSFATDVARVKELTQKLMCTCGTCNATLGHCPHSVTCSNYVGMMKEVTKMVDDGKSDDAILAAFADKFGATVLSAPTTSGFNLVAWVMPFVALAGGLIAVVFFVRRFRGAPSAVAVSEGVDPAKYDARIEEELKKYSPED